MYPRYFATCNQCKTSCFHTPSREPRFPAPCSASCGRSLPDPRRAPRRRARRPHRSGRPHRPSSRRNVGAGRLHFLRDPAWTPTALRLPLMTSPMRGGGTSGSGDTTSGGRRKSLSSLCSGVPGLLRGRPERASGGWPAALGVSGPRV